MIFAAEVMSGVDPSWGWQAVLFLFGAVFLWEKLTAIMNSKRIQERKVSMVEGAATQADVAAVKRDCQERVAQVKADVTTLAVKMDAGFEKIGEQMKESETRILDKDEARSVALHERLNEFGDRLGELRGEMKGRTGI